MAQKKYLIQPISGFTPQVGALLSMMETVRKKTKERVLTLTTVELDWRFDQKANSIGMLLGHIAAVEEVHTIPYLETREPTSEEHSFLKPRLELGDAGFEAMQGKRVEEYITNLDRVRERTINGLRNIDDEELNSPISISGTEVNLHWTFFHVMEDELHHTGQIAWLLKRMP
jgi:uncharacterized damage-inducible protein DinB